MLGTYRDTAAIFRLDCGEKCFVHAKNYNQLEALCINLGPIHRITLGNGVCFKWAGFYKRNNILLLSKLQKDRPQSYSWVSYTCRTKLNRFALRNQVLH